jgi:hypothetical protein
MNVYISCIYVFNLRSSVKFSKWRKCTTFITKRSDMQRGLTRILTGVQQWTISAENLIGYISLTAKSK